MWRVKVATLRGHWLDAHLTPRIGYQLVCNYFAATTPPTVDDPVPLHPFPP
jgi:hypothetical protein